ncbi:MAG: thioredoxin family protein [Thermoguttaceae bacterium]|nr:thioredoxin family protein [Thermoguttaceae bacterium]
MPKRLFRGFLFLLFLALTLRSAEAREGFRVQGRLIPAGGETAAWERPADAAGNPVAYLAVRGEFPGAHIYSLTQKKGPGGYPTALSIRFPSEESPFIVGAFRGASPTTNVDFGGFVLEEWIDRFDAVAPVWRRDGNSDADPGLLAEEFLSCGPEGTIDALCCDDHACEPVRETFPVTAGADSAGLEPLLAFVRASELFDPGTGQAKAAAGAPIWRNLLYAFFGGMILNIMPCVLPVIGLKIVSFFEQAGKNRARAFYLNLCYTAGILTVFTVLAVLSVGLSYLFTYGAFQIVMGCIVFAMALNLMGVWEITLPGFLGGKRSNALMGKEGGIGGWFKGVITTLLAIPCGAPLLSPALVWTDSLMKSGETVSVLFIYWVIGLGMAAPFLVIGAFPELLRFLPKPGKWMETFRGVMGFVLLLAVIWIFYSMPLALILPTAALLAAIWFACWLLGRNQFDPGRKPLRLWLIAAAVFAAVVLFSFELPPLRSDGSYPLPTLQSAFQEKLTRWGVRAAREGELVQKDWRLFGQGDFEEELARGKTVAVDFTADWCMNCKVLEAAVLRDAEIAQLFREKGIVTMTGDWTQRDESEESREVGALLRRYGGEQVPVLMIFTPAAPEEPIILRGLFTKETLKEKLKNL